MGGNALKNAVTERKQTDEYKSIEADVLAHLHMTFGVAIRAIPAYANKESFGDADILIESDFLPSDWLDQVRAVFSPQEMVSNGGVHSFDYRGLQIDLITCPQAEFKFALTYFAFNDLGNLMGRIAHKMGFKYGHQGLFKTLRNEKQEPYAEILVSRDVEQVFRFMGYDHARFLEGFDTLEQVFEFAASTPYFHRSIYQLENRNNKSRIRDEKRPSYMAFLKWIENRPELDKIVWADHTDGVMTNAHVGGQMRAISGDKVYWQREALRTFEWYGPRCAQAYFQYAEAQKVKIVWNGEIVGHQTGYSGKRLGQFMAHCKQQKSEFNRWALMSAEGDIRRFIVTQMEVWERKQE